jgi:hypothetical protein
LRRLIIIGTAAAVLVGAAAAYAAFNNYAGSGVSFSPSGAGTPASPKNVNMTEVLKANAPSGQRAAPLTNIKLVIYGLKTNGGKFPTCTDSQITANPAKYEQACPKGSQIAQGPVHSLLGPASNSSSATPPATPCNPYLKVYNGGQGTQVFFFTTSPHAAPQYTCAGLPTGATAPYDGHISKQGKNWVLNVPLPPDISNKVANQPGLYGSLITETLFPVSETTKVKGKSVGYMQSVGCKGHKRPFSITFTAQSYPANGGNSETQTVSGNAKC